MKLKIPGLHEVCRICSNKITVCSFYQCKCGDTFERPQCPHYCNRIDCAHTKICPECERPNPQRIEYAGCSKCLTKSPSHNGRCRRCGRLCLKRLSPSLATYISICPTCDVEAGNLLQASGIQPEFGHKLLNDMEMNGLNPPLISFIKASTPPVMLSLPKRWPVLSGSEGIGKTEFGCILLRRLMTRLVPARCIDFPSYMETLRPASYDYADKSKAIVAEYREMLDVPALLVDNIREQAYTPFQKGHLHEIINHRSSRWLLTVITTQYDPDGLAKAFDRDTVSRIMQRSGPWFVPGVIDMRTRPIE